MEGEQPSPQGSPLAQNGSANELGTNINGLTGLEDPHRTVTPEGRELTWGERLSKNGFWVFNYLQGIGPTKNLRELAQTEGINFDAGLEELRSQGLLDESTPEYPEVKLEGI